MRKSNLSNLARFCRPLKHYFRWQRNLFTKIVHHTAILLRKEQRFRSFTFNWSFEKLK